MQQSIIWGYKCLLQKSIFWALYTPLKWKILIQTTEIKYIFIVFNLLYIYIGHSPDATKLQNSKF